MQSILRLDSFKIYNIILLVSFSIIINSNNYSSLIHSIFYCILHFTLIYLCIYYYRKLLYPIFIIYGLFLDILLLNEIGPHLLVFILILSLLNLFSKYFYNLTSIKIYFFIIIIQLLFIFLEILLSFIFYNFNLDISYLIQLIIFTLIMSFPVFLFFSKIDQIN